MVNADLHKRISDVYTLQISATDKGNPPRKAIVTATITITDVNHPPVFIPSPPVNVSDDKKIDTQVIRAMATDPDKGVDGEITFGISGGNEEGLFKINKVRETAHEFRRLKQY